MGTDPKFVFSRACVDRVAASAVRPQRSMCVKCRSVNAIDDGDDGEEGVGSSEGERQLKKVIDPLLPSKAEISEHQLSHLPYRSWCPHCVKGRAREMGHQRHPRTERGLDEYHVAVCSCLR